MQKRQKKIATEDKNILAIRKILHIILNALGTIYEICYILNAIKNLFS